MGLNNFSLLRAKNNARLKSHFSLANQCYAKLGVNSRVHLVHISQRANYRKCIWNYEWRETEGLWYVYSTYFFLVLLWFLISPTLVTVERLRNRKTHHNISIPGYYPDIQTKINIFPIII